MLGKLRSLQRQGLIQKVHGTELRSGKAAAANLAEQLADGDLIVNVDCDCSFDRHALREITRPFAEPNVGAIAGNILIRNQGLSLWTNFQAIEYLISISLGKRAQDMVGQVTCASGAFSAYRKVALTSVGGLDAGGGEDLDVTLRLRKADWQIRFALSSHLLHRSPQFRDGTHSATIPLGARCSSSALSKTRHLDKPLFPQLSTAGDVS